MLLPGSQVVFEGQTLKLLEIKNLQQVVVVDKNGKHRTLRVDQLRVPVVVSGRRSSDLASISKDQVSSALHAANALKLLAATPKHKRSVLKVDEIAQMLQRSRATIYRWLDRYTTQPSISSLMRKQRSDIGTRKLAQEVEAVIAEEIETGYLSLNRPSIATTAENVRSRCAELGLHPPDESTVRDRIHRLEPSIVELRRYGSKAATDNFQPLRGSFPNADYPLAVVQIDHTPMDVIVVDDQWRKPIGRPFLTLAMDVRTKMVVGFYISLEHPGALSTGLCLSQAILRKEAFLEEQGLGDLQWPCWGKMRTVHSDNAKEFRGTMLGLACAEHGINPERRPKHQPRYGGHIERGFRTWMSKVHEELPGTTFSNVQDKFDYDAEGHAVMTLSALIKWFTEYLLGYYHQKPHAGNNNIPPMRMWEQLLVEGTEDVPAVGLPSPVENPEQLRLDFLPLFTRTVQEYGIQNWNLQWYSDALRRFIHAKDPNNPTEAKEFICRYDPRDLSRIWFWDDRTRTYIEIPFRDKSRPAISLWEVKEAKRLNRQESKLTTNEELIFRTIARMRKIVQQEAELTKAARRRQQRQQGWEEAQKTARSRKAPPVATPKTSGADGADEDVSPFDDIREL